MPCLSEQCFEEDHHLFSEMGEVYAAVLPLHCRALFPSSGEGMGAGGCSCVCNWEGLSRLQVTSSVSAPAEPFTSSAVPGLSFTSSAVPGLSWCLLQQKL